MRSLRKNCLLDGEAYEIIRQIAEWREERYTRGKREGKPRYSQTTINHWRSALSDLYTQLNGKSGYNPLRDVPKLPVPDAIDRAQPMSLVETILNQMEVNGCEFGAKRGVSDSTIRARILAYTGMRESDLKRLSETDIRLDGDEPVVQLQTGKGASSVECP